MRILYLFPQFPWPPDSGGKIVTYHMLRHMAKNHQITLWTFAQDRRDYQNLSHLKSYCDRIELFPARRRLQPVALVRALFGKLPYKALRWHDRGVAARLRELLAREHYDIIHAQNLTTAQYLTGRESGATLYYKENLEALILSRYAEVVRLAPLRWLLRREAAKTLRLELHLRLCDQLVVISDADGARLCEMDPASRPRTSPRAWTSSTFNRSTNFSLLRGRLKPVLRNRARGSLSRRPFCSPAASITIPTRTRSSFSCSPSGRNCARRCRTRASSSRARSPAA
ncbi:glycosyltransferase [bacterium]|nr:glycosyltransferase [bacterium]